MMSGDRGKMSPPDNWLSRLLDKKWKYNRARDDFETMQKERFMYGAPLRTRMYLNKFFQI